MYKLHCLTCEDTVSVIGPEDGMAQLFADAHREHDIEINGMSPAVFFNNLHNVQVLMFETLQPVIDEINKIGAEYISGLNRKGDGE